MIIGDRLKAVRESKKMSQGDIEKKTGLLRCYVSRVEQNHTVPSIETLEKFARALEVPLYQLFYEGKNAEPLVIKNGHAPKLNRVATNHLRRIGLALARMSPRNIVILTHLANKFAEK